MIIYATFVAFSNTFYCADDSPKQELLKIFIFFHQFFLFTVQSPRFQL